MTPVCPSADLPRGASFRLQTGPPVAVVHTEEGEVYAIDDACTHQDASLADGRLEGRAVECPPHASTFGLRTGGVDASPARLPVRTHRVVVEDGTVHVLPVVRRLAAAGAVVSVDTMRAEVAARALEAGARLVNDVSGGLADPAMPSLMARADAPYVLCTGADTPPACGRRHVTTMSSPTWSTSCGCGSTPRCTPGSDPIT
ncbi:hypothetical protein GCM10010524_30340 [Streptomyces mexicanus]